MITLADLESLATGELREEGISVRRLGLGIGHWVVEGPIESFRPRSAKRALAYVRTIRREMAREHVSEGLTARIVEGRLTRITCTRCGRSITIGLNKRSASPNYVLYLDSVVPALTADIKRATGGWHITHAIEVERR